jgi:WD40 repeat protein/uncharacterized caspase-like protein
MKARLVVLTTLSVSVIASIAISLRGQEQSAWPAYAAPKVQVHTTRLAPPRSIAFAADNRTLVVSDNRSDVSLWDIARGVELRSLVGSQRDALRMDFRNSQTTEDGRFLAAVDMRGTVRFWDLATHREITLIAGQSDEGYLTGISPDLSLMTFRKGEKNSVVGIMQREPNKKTFERYYLNASQEGSTEAVAMDRLARLMAIGTYTGSIEIADLRRRRIIRTLSGAKRPVANLTMDPAGNKVAATLASPGCIDFKTTFLHSDTTTVHEGGHIFDTTAKCRSGFEAVIWDIQSGKEVGSFASNSGPIYQLAFTPDGRLLGVATSDGIRLFDWEHKTTSHIYERTPDQRSDVAGVRFAFSHDSARLAVTAVGPSIAIVDMSGGKILRTLDRTLNSDASFAGFGARDTWFAVRNGRSLVWLGDGQTQRSLNSPLKSQWVTQNGSTVIGVDRTNRLQVWDPGMTRGPMVVPAREFRERPPSRRCISPAAENQDYQNELTVDAAGAVAATAGKNGVTIWKTADCSPIKTLPWAEMKMATEDYLGIVGLEGKPFSSVGLRGDVMALSPSGKLLAYANTGNYVVIYDWQRGLEITRIRVPVVNFSGRPNTPLAERELVRRGSSERVGISSLKDDAQGAFEFKQWPFGVKSIRFSPDERLLATLDSNRRARLWDAANGRLIRTYVMPWQDDITSPGGFTFSPDGKLGLASFEADREARLFDMTTGELVRSFHCDDKGFLSLAFRTDGRYVTSTSGQRNCIWDATTGAHLATVVLVGSSDWLVFTPDGLFDGTSRAFEQVRWRFSEAPYDVVPVGAFLREFYRPGLMREILSGRSPKAPRQLAEIDRRQPFVAILPAEDGPLPAVVTERLLRLRVLVRQFPGQPGKTQGSGVYGVRVFRNGYLIGQVPTDYPPDAASGITLSASFPVIAGENRFTAYAFNRDNVKSADAILTVRGDGSLRPKKSAAYIVSIGVNHYANAQFDLKYAVPDANLFGEEVKQKLQEEGRQAVSIPLLDQDARRENILEVFRRLLTGKGSGGSHPSSLDALQIAQPEDSLFIYFAGHGIALGDRFYLIPHDLAYNGSREALRNDPEGLRQITEHSISDLDLAAMLRDVDCRQIVLVVDSCNSGQALESRERRQGPFNSGEMVQAAYDKHMYVLTASQGYQAALETAKLGHGYLTYALIEEGLKQGFADQDPADRVITMKEWLDYAVARVPELQQEYTQARLLLLKSPGLMPGQPISGSGAPFLQEPRVFYRQDSTIPLFHIR